MRKQLIWAVLAGMVVFAAGCRGAEGPMGPTGPTGSTGVSLLREYTGTISEAGDFEFDVPEITGKRQTTFVEVYWALSSAPDIWTPMSDGWKDDAALSRTSAVSWTYGKVYFFGMSANDLYLIKVYQND